MKFITDRVYRIDIETDFVFDVLDINERVLRDEILDHSTKKRFGYIEGKNSSGQISIFEHSHLLTKVEENDEGEFFAEIMILDTTNGRYLEEYLRLAIFEGEYNNIRLIPNIYFDQEAEVIEYKGLNVVIN